MCGICGFAGELTLREMDVARMAETLRHRGPDDAGQLVEPGRVGLGFRRLSIIDLERGNQPITNEDGRIAVTCNGEIYNFKELREALRRRGHEFATGSDTEVIVHAYEEHGLDFVHELQGMFAIALWDGRRERLVLARDRLGVKPLYWAAVPGGLVYGSEPAAILTSGLVPARIDPAAILDYLALQYVPPPRTGFAGIEKLRPGQMLVWERGRAAVETYWQLDYSEQDGYETEAVLDTLDTLLRDATRSRLVADVPLGAFLSGGVDSSLIVSYMAELQSDVRTFSADFRIGEFSEGRHAKAVSSAFGTTHTEFVVEPEMVPLATEIVRYLGEPFADSSAIPTFVLSRLTRQHVTVALSGDGGDEAFGGYVRYLVADAGTRFGPLSRAVGVGGRLALPLIPPKRRSRVRYGLATLARPRSDRYPAMMTHFDPPALRRLCEPGFLAAAEDDATRAWRSMQPPAQPADANSYMRLDVENYLPGDILVKVDRMSMANGLEVRSPLLDYRVQEFAAKIPAALKLRTGETKVLLKELAARRGVPVDVVHRPKRGFGVPIGEWFRSDLQSWLNDVLRDPGARQRGIVRPDVVDRLIDEHVTGVCDHAPGLWHLVMLELWQQHWIDD